METIIEIGQKCCCWNYLLHSSNVFCKCLPRLTKYYPSHYMHVNSLNSPRRFIQNNDCIDYPSWCTVAYLVYIARRMYLTLTKRDPWNNSCQRWIFTQRWTYSFYAPSNTNKHSKTNLFYFGQSYRLALAISVKTTPVKPMILTQHFEVNDFWQSAYLRRDASRQPYVRQPYYPAKLLLFRLPSLIQTNLCLTKGRATIELTIETIPPRLSIKTFGTPQHTKMSTRLNQNLVALTRTHGQPTLYKSLHLSTWACILSMLQPHLASVSIEMQQKSSDARRQS